MPHPALPTANWADCYEIDVRAPTLTAVQAAHMALGHFPPWVKWLMHLRDAIVAVLGLKTSSYHTSGKLDMIGMFPVISSDHDEVVLGFDDRHLDFRIVIRLRRLTDGRQIISATTLVDRKILLGRLYIALITPFHKLIVAAMLANLGKRAALT
ncbi:DUF2867 domain-containing protein [Rhizobium sp. KVB221]|uniref:DUF2867 domain-containing protein n=1 Tax=Rhizobium setariae TaxID=2801340 RepID=A0A936YVU8_9HYPH|nr:DUF2867 domain-containing protein [Rhizobium setariae]MBL0374070.1 DUF2867 domain-containing protein [Rhizobium setariae]